MLCYALELRKAQGVSEAASFDSEGPFKGQTPPRAASDRLGCVGNQLWPTRRLLLQKHASFQEVGLQLLKGQLPIASKSI